jgi:hypothetical protein
MLGLGLRYSECLPCVTYKYDRLDSAHTLHYGLGSYQVCYFGEVHTCTSFCHLPQDSLGRERNTSLILLEQSLYSLHLVLSRLLLIRPRTHSDITLNPHNAILMQHGVALPNDSHDIVPWAL